MGNLMINIDHDMVEVFKMRGDNICKRVAFIDLKEVALDELDELVNAAKTVKGQEG